MHSSSLQLGQQQSQQHLESSRRRTGTGWLTYKTQVLVTIPLFFHQLVQASTELPQVCPALQQGPPSLNILHTMQTHGGWTSLLAISPSRATAANHQIVPFFYIAQPSIKVFTFFNAKI